MHAVSVHLNDLVPFYCTSYVNVRQRCDGKDPAIGWDAARSLGRGVGDAEQELPWTS